MKTKSIFVLTAMVAMAFFGCKESPYINAPGDNDYNYPELPTWEPDTNGTVISVDEAYEIGILLKEDEKSAIPYKISGKITSIVTKEADITSGKYSSITFYMSDGGQHEIEAYLTNNINNRPFRDPSEIPAVGSQVTVQGRLTTYQKTVELTDSYLVKVTPPEGN